MKNCKNRPSQRPTGYGKALDSPPQGLDETISGKTDRADGHGEDRQAKINRPKARDWDDDYGNVSGPYSQPVKGIS